MNDFSDEFKVSLIADARDIDKKIIETRAKLEAWKRVASEQAQLKIRITIAELDSKLSEARKKLAEFRKEGDKASEIKTRLEISGLQQNKNQASKILRDLQSDTSATEKSFFSLNGIVKDALKAFGGFYLIRETVRALQDAMDASVKFESAFAGIRKTVQATPEEFAKLEGQFRSLATQIPLSVEALSKIGETAGQLGVKKNDLIEFTETIAAIGVSTNLTEDQAATSFARIANIYQQPISKVQNLASSVVALGNNFATTESEIVNFATNIAGAGKIAGLTTSDIAGISAAFTSVGIEAEAGGTAISKTLQAISDAVVKGGTDLDNFANIAGTSSKNFAELWKSEPVKAFQLFVEGLGRSGDKASAVLDDLVAGDTRLKKAFLSVANAGDLLSRAIQTSKTAFEENTALTDEASKRYATTESQLQLLSNRWNDIKISVGNFLKAVAVPVLNFFVTLAEALGGARNNLYVFAQALKVIGVVIATVLSISTIKKIVEGISSLAGAVEGVTSSLKVASSAGTGFAGSLSIVKSALLAITTPLGFVAAAVGILAGAWLYAENKAQEFKDSVENLNKTISQSTVNPTQQKAGQNFTSSLQSVKSLGENAQGGNRFASITDQAQKIQDDLPQKIGNLRGETERLLLSLGLTNKEVGDFTQNLSYFKDVVGPSSEDMKKLNDKVAESSPIIADAAQNFANQVETLKRSNLSWKASVAQITAANKTQFEKNGQNAELMTKQILETYVGQIAKSQDVGTAAAVAYGAGFSSSESRDAIDKGVGTQSDEMLSLQLAAAIRAGENGKAAGLLHALGIGDESNLQAVEESGTNLNDAVISALNSGKGAIYSSGLGAGQNVVAGIVNGIVSKIPVLQQILNSVARALGGFASMGKALLPLASTIPGINGLISSFGSVDAIVQKIKNDTNAYLNAAKAPTFGGDGSGGGGKGGGGNEEKKKAQEAKQAVDEFTKSVEANNKAAEKLRDNTVSFYQDIINTIDKAKQKQKELVGELNKFKQDETKSFAKSSGERDYELAQKQLEVEKELKKAKKELSDADPNAGSFQSDVTNAILAQSIAQQKLNEATATGKQIQIDEATLALNKAKQRVEDLQANNTADNADAKNTVLEKEKELNDILNERKKIEEFLNGLQADTAKAQEAYDKALKSGNEKKIASAKAALDQAKLNKDSADAFNEAKRRAGLTQWEQNQLAHQDKIKEREYEVQLEIDKQNQIIAIQKRFLELQNATTAADLEKKKQLNELASSGILLTEEERQKKLEALGFKDLTADQELELLKQVQKASDLQNESEQIRAQQEEILAARQKYIDLAESYHGEAVDKMKEKEQELIDLIQKAIEQQIILNDLRGAANATASSVAKTQNINVVQNNNSNVDVNAALNQTLNKVK